MYLPPVDQRHVLGKKEVSINFEKCSYFILKSMKPSFCKLQSLSYCSTARGAELTQPHPTLVPSMIDEGVRLYKLLSQMGDFCLLFAELLCGPRRRSTIPPLRRDPCGTAELQQAYVELSESRKAKRLEDQSAGHMRS